VSVGLCTRAKGLHATEVTCRRECVSGVGVMCMLIINCNQMHTFAEAVRTRAVVQSTFRQLGDTLYSCAEVERVLLLYGLQVCLAAVILLRRDTPSLSHRLHQAAVGHTGLSTSLLTECYRRPLAFPRTRQRICVRADRPLLRQINAFPGDRRCCCFMPSLSASVPPLCAPCLCP